MPQRIHHETSGNFFLLVTAQPAIAADDYKIYATDKFGNLRGQAYAVKAGKVFRQTDSVIGKVSHLPPKN